MDSRTPTTTDHEDSLRRSKSTRMARTADRQTTSGRSATLLQQDGSNNKTYEDDAPLRLLGIALVVDQVGKGARMVLRYPTQPLDESEDDLFFRLPPRQMAKLFRPKPALCGQPMTLSVGGTFFCCCAVLMEDVAEQASDASFDPVVLFSVIVALAPQVDTSTVAIAGSIRHKPEKRQGRRQTGNISASSKREPTAAPARLEGRLPTPVPAARFASMSILCIRSVHVSLARLCRVLEREERRCHFVSKQASLFRQIRHDLHKHWNQEHIEEPTDTTTNISNSNSTNNPMTVSNSATTSPVSLASKTLSESRTSLSRPSSFAMNYDSRSSDKRSSKADGVISMPLGDRLQMELEHFLAATPPEEHSGNLARELAQVYHALGRNEYDFPSSPAALLTGRDGIVYINRHIAVAVEAVAPTHNGSSFDTASTTVRPYHTLLFPNATPRQMLDSLAPTGAPRRLQQFLRAVSPKRSLTEIALEASLPLQSTLDMAAYLIHQGVCIVSHVISSSTKVVCNGIDKIQESCLRFSQTFGTTLDLFVLVSLLTDNTNSTLGETLLHLTRTSGTADSTVQWLQEELHPLLPFQSNHSAALDGQDAGGNGSQYIETSRMMGPENVSQEEGNLKDLLFRMTVWLFSHRVLVPLCDFLVLTTANTTTSNGPNTIDEDASSHYSFDHRGAGGGRGVASSAPGEHKVDGSWRLSVIDHSHNIHGADDFLLRELEQDCLSGTTSIPAASWRTGLDLAKVRAWANGHDRVRIVWRVPTPSDDWGDGY